MSALPAQIRRGNAGCDDAPPSRPITWLGSSLPATVAAGMSAPTSGRGSAVRREPAARGRGPGRVLDSRTLCRGRQANGHGRPDVRAVPNSQNQDPSLPRGDDPRRRADGVEFPRHTGRTPGLGRRLCRQRLCRLRRRSVGTRPVGVFGDSYGKTRKPSVENVEQRFTAPERKQLWPQASLHTQWPGTGTQGDAAFDAFYASQVETIGDEALIEQMNRDAGASRCSTAYGRRCC